MRHLLLLQAKGYSDNLLITDSNQLACPSDVLLVLVNLNSKGSEHMVHACQHTIICTEFCRITLLKECDIILHMYEAVQTNISYLTYLAAYYDNNRRLCQILYIQCQLKQYWQCIRAWWSKNNIHLHGSFFTWIFDMDAMWTFTFLQCVH